MRTSRLLAAAGAALLLSLTACSGGSDADSPTDAGGGADGGAAGAPAMQEGADAAEVPPEAPADASRGYKAANAVDLQAQQALIKTGAVSLLSDDVGKTRFDVQALLDQHNGQVAEDKTETDKSGQPLRSRMVVRVPVQDFDEVMDALGRLDQLVSTTTSSEDVTTQVIDVDARIKVQEASVERVRQLLTQAQSIRDIMAIESQLSNRQAELDSLKQQQAYLKDQTSLATINVNIERKPDAIVAKKKDDRTGFLAGLDAGWDGLKGTVVAVLTVVGAVLPFAGVGLLIGVPVWLLVRRVRRTPPTAEPAPATD